MRIEGLNSSGSCFSIYLPKRVDIWAWRQTRGKNEFYGVTKRVPNKDYMAGLRMIEGFLTFDDAISSALEWARALEGDDSYQR